MNEIISLTSNRLIYRPYISSDSSFIHELCTDPYYKYAKEEPFFKESETEQNVIAYMVYNRDNRFIGYIKTFYPLKNNNIWIQTLLINKPYTQQGYGKEIIQALIHELQHMGPIHKIYLTCHQRNTIGSIFWKKLGFIKMHINIKSTNDLYTAELRSLTCITNHL